MLAREIFVVIQEQSVLDVLSASIVFVWFKFSNLFFFNVFVVVFLKKYKK